MADPRYDVFISYRRESGAAEALVIRQMLIQRGLRVFLDVSDLERGYFDETLLTRIAETPNFLVVLSLDSLDRCADPEDWLRREIAQACKSNRNIITVMMSGFKFRRDLPEDIKSLPRFQGVEYSHIYHKAMVDRIMESVEAERAERGRLEQERAEAERLRAEKEAEEKHLAQEQAEREAREREEKERVAREAAEAERRAKEEAGQEQLAREQAEEKRTESLCMGCMANKGNARFCGDCGWEEGTPAESPLQLPPRTVLDGRYLLGRALGQGGFGITYLAWDLNLNRKLAIKEYFPREVCTRARDEHTVQPLTHGSREAYAAGQKRFLEEAQALARFQDHPGIVSVLGFFQENGTAYLVMVYVEGRTLKQYLEERNGKMPFQAALNILTPVMDALREVHRVGMLHRDISPDNIYLNRRGQVKILDFGAARYAMGELSRSLDVILKPGYAPEEQYRYRGKQGPWTDVYALGATLYRAVTGQPPTAAPDRLEHDDLVSPSRLGVEIPAKSEVALLKALAVRAGNRFQSIAEFQKAVSAEPQPAEAKGTAAQRTAQGSAEQERLDREKAATFWERCKAFWAAWKRKVAFALMLLALGMGLTYIIFLGFFRVRVTLSPSSASLAAEQKQQFTVTVKRSSKNRVKWSLNPEVGSISQDGVYTAPSLVPTSLMLQVIAKSEADPTKLARAIVTLIPVSVSLSPTQTALEAGENRQFTATVTGTSNTAVTWKLEPQQGRINNGDYTAPASISQQQDVKVTATSVADTAKFATATVTLKRGTLVTAVEPPTPVVLVTVSPPRVTLEAGGKQHFKSIVTGTSNTAVTWKLEPQQGKINNGDYTAPASISQRQDVTVTATSVADTAKFATATVTVKPPTPVVTVSPPRVTLEAGGKQQFTATVTGTSKTDVTWKLEPEQGRIKDGEYTAPASISEQQAVKVIATSVADKAKFATATVTLKPPTRVVLVKVSPPRVTLEAGGKQQFTATVTGTSKTDVTWKLEPEQGRIKDGEYTAPASISQRQDVTVTATSVADTAKFATATVTLTTSVRGFRVAHQHGPLAGACEGQLTISNGRVKYQPDTGNHTFDAPLDQIDWGPALGGGFLFKGRTEPGKAALHGHRWFFHSPSTSEILRALDQAAPQ